MWSKVIFLVLVCLKVSSAKPLNESKWMETDLAEVCLDLSQNHGFKQVQLFEETARQKQDCCIAKLESECSKWSCGQADGSTPSRDTAWKVNWRACSHFKQRLALYQDSLITCTLLGHMHKCDLMHNRNGSATEKSGTGDSGGGGMPIWLIILIVILIIAGIIMIGIVIWLFMQDKESKESKKGKSSHSKGSHKNKSRKTSKKPIKE